MILPVTGCQRKGNENYVPGSLAQNEETSAADVTKETTTEKPTRPPIDPSDKLIALTFDDGPYSPTTNKILDTLEKYNVPATFFVVGNRVSTYSDSVKRAHNMGCEFGSHTYSHKVLTKISSDEISRELNDSSEAIRKITGEDIKIMRPPEGAVNDSVRENVPYPLIMWSVDSKDWVHKKDSDKSYHEVYDYVFDGAIVLMHDIQPGTPDAVSRLIPDLQAQGYRFVTVSELMDARGIQMENGESYGSARPPVEEEETESSEESVGTEEVLTSDSISD